MTKPKQSTFYLQFKLKLDIGFEVKAASLEDALAQARDMKVADIVDFQANGWDHNDSEAPQLTGISAT